MNSLIVQSYPIQSILKYEFLLEVWGLMHYMFENNIIITGGIVLYSVTQWDNFKSDLDIWVPPSTYEKKNQFHTLLCLNGYYLSRIDCANEEDKTEFSSKIEMVAHYIKNLPNGEYKLIDVVYTKKSPEVILERTDLTINMNYAKVVVENGLLVFNIYSLNDKSKFDLINKILSLNSKILNGVFLNNYEANRKKLRFEKYIQRGFIPDPIIKETYYQIMDKFISGEDVKQKNGIGLSMNMINLQNELIGYIERRELFA